ncbi:hypothetical protein [Domibacillus aminovorans]|uniref:LexA repressor DNA-binding domain-containing protein n=1 Tax=Domibacillus aminovorans TaxID=29332 RepID=A0A177L9S4_9BACI|nr:hypothetical protein [Domibacillus aminovorans]OAH61925.1 hypothetical protein AWH49_10910 [Domibacillus aminovorans]
MQLTQRQQEIFTFIESFSFKHLEIPSIERIVHEFEGSSASRISRAMNSLCENGLLFPIINRIKEEQ